MFYNTWMKICINDVPEHIERVLLRPIVENFCYSYMHKNKYEHFTIKYVEFISKTNIGKANIYFTVSKNKYCHIIIKIHVKKKISGKNTQFILDDPIIEVKDSKAPF
jgi:hypothetical protein